jgi:hypothetical protein
MTEIPTVDLGGGVTMPMVGFGTWQLGRRLPNQVNPGVHRVTSRSPPTPPGLT